MFSLSKSYYPCFALLMIFTKTVVAGDEHSMYVQLNAGAAFAPQFSEGFKRCIVTFDSNQTCDSFDSFSYKNSLEPGFVGGIAFGYHITDQFRLEGEAIYQSNDLNTFTSNFTSKLGGSQNSFEQSDKLQGERERTAFLLNAYYDFTNSSPFTPYITGGVGGYHLRIKASRFNSDFRPSRENDLDFAWQVGAGLNYKLSDRISFDLKYRYFSGADAEITIPALGVFSRDITELHDVGDHQVMAGIRVGF